MKSVLISIQPYYVFLIIARLIGWDIPQEKKIEVRKDFPKANDWNKVVHIYCSRNRKSFNRIPKEYQPFMAKLLGKVIGEFVCGGIMSPFSNLDFMAKESCLTVDELHAYSNGKTLYGWRISNLKIYEKPKELEEFWAYNSELNKRYVEQDGYCCYDGINEHGEPLTDCGNACDNIVNCYRCWEEWSGWCHKVTRPPQSWCYVDG